MKKILQFLIVPCAALGIILSACSGGVVSLDGDWKLISHGDASAPTAALPDVETAIKFDSANGQFGGTVGCNSFGTEYKINGDQITFGAIFSTEMYCEKVSEQEINVITILSDKTMSLAVNGNQLTLTSADGASVVVLERK